MQGSVSQRNAKSFWRFGVFLFGILVIIDLAAKSLSLNVYKNYFFAFGLPVNTYLMYGIYFAGIAGIAVYIMMHFSKLALKELIAWEMILAGAVANVGERIFLGFVRDWIYVLNGVFNLADGYIILGIIILLFPTMTKMPSEQK